MPCRPDRPGGNPRLVASPPDPRRVATRTRSQGEPMTKIGRSSFFAVVLVGQLASAQPVTDAEFKCIQKTDKALAKFVGAKSKCVSKCLSTFWKGDGPSADCFPPYDGITAQCIKDTVLGV